MEQQDSLTKHPQASLRELWSISLPLMISSLASLFMIFTDRIFLSHYSSQALNASVNAGTMAWAFMAGISMVTAMSEVFVAQYNGAKKWEKLGVPVWQMIWFALSSFLFFIPMGVWGSGAIFQNNLHQGLETIYFQWLMFFGPSVALMTAFAGFFIGRGKTRILIWLALVANLINIVLDWILIFGIPGLVPEMGIEGAAIATCTGYVFQAAILGYLFLKRENRERFGTSLWQFDWEEMKKCFKIGIPQGVFCCLEILGWTVFYWMMTSISQHHITVSSICQSFLILFSFFYDGLSRGATAVVGNLIGARKHELVAKVLKAGFCLLFFFSLLTALFLVINPEDTSRLLFSHSLHHSGEAVGSAMEEALSTCLIYSFIYLLFEGCRWLLSGILVAAGDTLFLLIAGSVSVWVFLLLPLYFFVVRSEQSVEWAWGMTAAYSLFLLVVYWVRFKQGAWKKIDLIENGKQKAEELV